jgi:hypothetical protein
MHDNMRGSLVVARCYRDAAVVLRVWDCNKNVIYLSEESQFQRLSTGLDALRPVGFPANDVFAYDPALAEKLGSDALDWSSLKKFSALSRQI